MPTNRPFYPVYKDLAARTDLTLTAKVVYGVIVNRIGTNSDCWPSLRRIAADLNISAGAVADSVKQLEETGLIVITHAAVDGKRRSNRYALSVSAQQVSAQQVSAQDMSASAQQVSAERSVNERERSAGERNKLRERIHSEESANTNQRKAPPTPPRGKECASDCANKSSTGHSIPLTSADSVAALSRHGSDAATPESASLGGIDGPPRRRHGGAGEPRTGQGKTPGEIPPPGFSTTTPVPDGISVQPERKYGYHVQTRHPSGRGDFQTDAAEVQAKIDRRAGPDNICPFNGDLPPTDRLPKRRRVSTDQPTESGYPPQTPMQLHPVDETDHDDIPDGRHGLPAEVYNALIAGWGNGGGRGLSRVWSKARQLIDEAGGDTSLCLRAIANLRARKRRASDILIEANAITRAESEMSARQAERSKPPPRQRLYFEKEPP